MLNYLLRRLILLPITLFCIMLINFVIINMAPGDPTTVTEISQEGAATRKENRSVAFGSDDRYLQFRLVLVVHPDDERYACRVSARRCTARSSAWRCRARPPPGRAGQGLGHRHDLHVRRRDRRRVVARLHLPTRSIVTRSDESPSPRRPACPTGRRGGRSQGAR